MTADQLIAEGRALARPCLCLRERRDGEAVVGVWGGEGIVPLPGDSTAFRRHWVSIDCGWLRSNGFGLPGVLSLYEAGRRQFVVVHGPGGILHAEGSHGLALAGEEQQSLPPLEALEVYGCESTRHWLREVGPQVAAVGAAYDREYRKQLPLYQSDWAAMVGGWHMMWPDTDAYGEEPGRLVFWTLRDSEPWVEVWLDDLGNLKAVQRIT